MVRKRFPRVLISSFSVAFFLTLTSFSPIRTFAKGAEMLWEQLDVEITVLPSGDFWVHETHVIRFVSGGVKHLIFEIPANHLVFIHDVQAWEDGQPCVTGYEFGQFPSCAVSVDYDQGIGLASYRDWYVGAFLETASDALRRAAAPTGRRWRWK